MLSSWAWPTAGGVSASSPSCNPATAAHRSSTSWTRTSASTSPGTRRRATSCWSTRSCARPPANRTTGGRRPPPPNGSGRAPGARPIPSTAATVALPTVAAKPELATATRREMNRLAGETSPYLRQHSENPVDWYPRGDEAFEKARAEAKPVLLSVGYSSCHWCHVMAHESFEDPDVAAVMNRLVVSVKVDREERPDVDGIYMQAVQAMTGRGGWPMTVFVDPDGRPFFGGTYFPKEERHGMPGFVTVLEAVDEAWRGRRDDLLEQAGKLTKVLERTGSLGATGDGPATSHEILARGYESVRAQYDPQFGGFGPAPKFPQAMTLDFLLRTFVRNQASETLDMVRVSLDAMAAGGMYDQMGGGFHRYSTDAHWLVPHFEKMLYDQALLTSAYLHAHLVTGELRYRRVVEETIGYVLRDLRHEQGGFFSAEDADSEGAEGRFYLWSLEEIARVCGQDAPEVVRYFGVTEGGNFEDPHTGYRGNILPVVDRTEDPTEAVRRALPKLFAARG